MPRNIKATSLQGVKFVKNVEIFWISNKTIIEFSFRKMLRMRQISEAVFFNTHLGLQPRWITSSSISIQFQENSSRFSFLETIIVIHQRLSLSIFVMFLREWFISTLLLEKIEGCGTRLMLHIIVDTRLGYVQKEHGISWDRLQFLRSTPLTLAA